MFASSYSLSFGSYSKSSGPSGAKQRFWTFLCQLSMNCMVSVQLVCNWLSLRDAQCVDCEGRNARRAEAESHALWPAALRELLGDPIPYDDLAGIRKRKEILQHLRNVIYNLSPTMIAHQKTPQLPSDRRAACRQKSAKG